MNMLQGATIIMAAAVIAVSFSRKLGLGAIPGYIGAGVIIGPQALNLLTDSESILHFSEIGVVFLLFLIGLELRPARLWLLKKSIFGLGSVQVIATTVIIALLARLFTDSWIAAGVAGFAISLSSTAFGLQLITERKNLSSPHGRSALHILLFQDLLVIPVIALIPLWGSADFNNDTNLLEGIARLVATLLFFWLFSRYLLRPLLRLVANAQISEIFTSAALLLVLGSALVMHSVGISMALGAFLAGVLVADSEYRHQLESDIEPLKGLLLGLFFIAVGMSANLGILAEAPFQVLVIVSMIVAVKGLVLAGIGRVAGLDGNERWMLALCLSQGGEFGFIIFSLAADHQLIPASLKDLLIIAVTLSMVVTPVILFAFERLRLNRLNRPDKMSYDEINSSDPRVVIAGFGRFGQIVSRILQIQHIQFTAIDIDPGHVDFVRKLGNKVYYGDASNKHLLETADIKNAELFVLAIGNIERSLKVAALIKREYPQVKLFARARTRRHEMRLRASGADAIIRDTLLSSMHLAEQVLISLGIPDNCAAAIRERFYQHDTETLEKQYAHREDQAMLIKTSQDAARELEHLFCEDGKCYAERARN